MDLVFTLKTYVTEQAVVPGWSSFCPFVVGGAVDVQHFALPLNRVGCSHVVNKPSSVIISLVSYRKYLAALRKMSRSSRSRAFSFFTCRICSASDTAADDEVDPCAFWLVSDPVFQG